MLKKEARKVYLKKRNELSYTDKIKLDDLILIQFQTIDFPFLDYVLSFYPIEERMEINSILITDYLHFRNPNLQICYPKTAITDNTMKAISCQADSIFEANAFNIPEPKDTEEVPPESLDLVIVPLLAFDLQGIRVGYGKGYFDRYLKQCRPDCLKVGLSYFPPVDRIEDTHEFDVPLDFCITPERAYVF
ncbi:MAG: 5-formyltetrahydrofolate cyclo-ligase [Candidatus Dadabacteria bacterium]